MPYNTDFQKPARNDVLWLTDEKVPQDWKVGKDADATCQWPSVCSRHSDLFATDVDCSEYDFPDNGGAPIKLERKGPVVAFRFLDVGSDAGWHGVCYEHALEVLGNAPVPEGGLPPRRDVFQEETPRKRTVDTAPLPDGPAMCDNGEAHANEDDNPPAVVMISLLREPTTMFRCARCFLTFAAMGVTATTANFQPYEVVGITKAGPQEPTKKKK